MSLPGRINTGALVALAGATVFPIALAFHPLSAEATQPVRHFIHTCVLFLWTTALARVMGRTLHSPPSTPVLIMCGVSAALAVEYVQVLTPLHDPDPTGLAASCIGALLAALAVSRANSR